MSSLLTGVYTFFGPHMGGCQNYGPFLGTLNIRGRIIIGIQKGTIILTTKHIREIPYRKFSVCGTTVLRLHKRWYLL